MEYVQMTLDDWLREKEALRQELNSAVGAFVRIGYRLRKIRDGKLYERDGYKSLGEFAKAEYGLEKSTTSTFIAINEEFSKDGYSMELQERYQGLGSSVLAEMLKLSQEDRELVTMDTTRAQIRELKQFEKQEPQENNDLKGVVIEFFREHPKLLNDFYSSEGYVTGDMEELVDLINPSGNLSYRRGRYMLFFYGLEQGIKYKIFGETQTHQMTYTEFFALMQEIYADAISGSRTHEAYYGAPEVKTVTRETSATTTTVTPPQKVPPAEPEKPVNTGKDTQMEEPEEPQEPSGEATTGKTEAMEESEEENTEEKGTSSIPPINPPMQTRKEFLEGCTAWGAALYLSGWYKENSEAGGILGDANRLEAWLKLLVDDKGRELEA